jgi:uncharacterized protein
MPTRSNVAAFSWGSLIGSLGGLIGLGGAEYRLPLLISFFRFGALQSIILNKAMSLVVVGASIPFRMPSTPPSLLFSYRFVVLVLLSGSLFGAWLGAHWATQLASRQLNRTIAVLLVGIAATLLFAHRADAQPALLHGPLQAIVGVVAGFFIGIVAALLGVAGGEMLIPAIILLFGIDIKTAGTLALIVSFPTMLVAFIRYSRDQTFRVLAENRHFVLAMAAGSIGGSYVGSLLLGVVASAVLLPILSAIVVMSAVVVWRGAASGRHCAR